MKGSIIQVANMIFGNNIASRMVKIWLISNCSATSYLHYLVQLFPIFHNHDVGFAVISNVVAGLWRIGCIYSCDNPSRSKNCVCIYIFMHILIHLYLYAHTDVFNMQKANKLSDKSWEGYKDVELHIITAAMLVSSFQVYMNNICKINPWTQFSRRCCRLGFSIFAWLRLQWSWLRKWLKNSCPLSIQAAYNYQFEFHCQRNKLTGKTLNCINIRTEGIRLVSISCVALLTWSYLAICAR